VEPSQDQSEHFRHPENAAASPRASPRLRCILAPCARHRPSRLQASHGNPGCSERETPPPGPRPPPREALQPAQRLAEVRLRCRVSRRQEGRAPHGSRQRWSHHPPGGPVPRRFQPSAWRDFSRVTATNSARASGNRWRRIWTNPLRDAPAHSRHRFPARGEDTFPPPGHHRTG